MDATTVRTRDGAEIVLRRATAADVVPVVGLLAADQLGRRREDPDDAAPYLAAFGRIDADDAQLLVVAEDGGEVVGCLQLTFVPGLSRRGSLRCLVEGVRVRDTYRSRGFGAAMMGWVLAESRRRGCALVQLTTDKSRVDAHRFYARLGFTASHEGFKLEL